MFLTEYRLGSNKEREQELLDMVNADRSSNKVLNASLYVVEFSDNDQESVLECYPSGEKPFLYTDHSISEKKKDLICQYTYLEFKDK